MVVIAATRDFTVTFERARPEDVDVLIALERSVGNPKLYPPILDREGALEEIRKNSLYFIRIGDVIAGTAAYRTQPDGSVYISDLAVNPTYRGRGLARAAMSFLLEHARHASRIELVTHPDNEIALRLYASLGFGVESRRENYFGDGEPRLVLVRKIG